MHGPKLRRSPIDVAQDLMDQAREALEADDKLVASAKYEQAADYYCRGGYHYSSAYAWRRAFDVLGK